MARVNRSEVVATGEVAIYHCVNRCVRRAFLCGKDAVSGQSFEHRREWIRQRLEFLAGQFGLEVLGFAVMSNHLHVILRSRPDVVATWSDDEVARRWWRLFPQRLDADGNPTEPLATDLAMIQADVKKFASIRERLSDVSWFMRCLAEPIARRANREDDCTGRFWEGRFKCQPLLDETALAACSVYVDLNPVRAGVAKTPETSEYTSAHERIHAAQPRQEHAATGTGKVARETPRAKPRDGWLSPVQLAARREERSRQARRRASRQGFLPMTTAQYLELLDWTGRQVRHDKRGTIPAELAPILDRLQLSRETWVATVQHFGKWFRRAAGRPESLALEATRRGRRWLSGISHSREAFVS